MQKNNVLVQAFINNVKKLSEKSDEFEDDTNEENLQIRIAKTSYQLSYYAEKATGDQLSRISVAMGLLSQAQVMSDKDVSLASRLLIKARTLATKKERNK